MRVNIPLILNQERLKKKKEVCFRVTCISLILKAWKVFNANIAWISLRMIEKRLRGEVRNDYLTFCEE